MSILGRSIPYQAHPKRNIEMLTWIRGFAALIVVVSHIVQGACVSYWGENFDFHGDMPLALKTLSMGNFGVTLFFALSGCTLYLGYHHLNSGRIVQSFYLRRFARIYPAFAVSLVAYLLFRQWFQAGYPTQHGYWIEKQFLADFNWSEFLQYLTLTFNFRMESAIFNNAYWSLPVEFQFYLLFPLLLALHRRVPVVAIVLACGAAYICSILFGLTEFFTLGMVWQFGGGMICGHLYLRKPVRIEWRLGLLLLVLLHCTAVYVQYYDVPQFPGVYTGTYLGFIAILMVLVCVNVDVPVFSNRLSRFLSWQGEISYSIYLYHNLFVGAFVLLVLRWQLEGWPRVMFVGFGVLLCSYLAAHLSYHWVEKPGMNLGKRLARKLEKKGMLAESKVNLAGGVNP